MKLVTAVMIAATLMVGCGGGSGGAAAPSSAAAACDLNASITMANQFGDAYPLDPAKTQGPATDSNRYLVYDPLIRQKVDGSLAPSLATSWKWTTPTTLSLTLRQGVTFHDGTPFTAETMKATFDRGRALAAATTNFVQPLEPVVSVTAPSPTELVYTLKAPRPAFVYNLTGATGMPMSPSSFSQNLDFTGIGTGPYKVTKMTLNVGSDYVRNEQYWDKAPAACHPKEFHFLAFTDAGALLNGALSGQLQISYVQPSQTNQARTAKLTVTPISDHRILSFWFDHQKKPEFKMLKVRQALMYAVDRAGISKNIGLDLTKPDVQMFPPGVASYNPAEAYQPAKYPYDPAKSKQLLAEAGFPNGFSFTAAVSPTDIFAGTVLQAVQAQMKDAGITVTITPALSFAQFQNHGFDTYFGAGSGRADPLEYVNSQIAITGTFNPSKQPPPPEVQKLMDDIGLLEPTDPNRAKLMQQVVGLMVDHALVVPILGNSYIWAHSPCIVNFNPPSFGSPQLIGMGWKAGCK